MTKQYRHISFLPAEFPFVDISEEQNFLCYKHEQHNFDDR